jgi:hypothetical protein
MVVSQLARLVVPELLAVVAYKNHPTWRSSMQGRDCQGNGE